MKLKTMLNRYGLNALTIASIAAVAYFGLTDAGKQASKALLAESPVLFYGLLVPFAAIVFTWLYSQAKKRVK